MAEGADNSDHATDLEIAFNLAALAAARKVEPVPKDFDGETCYDCGSDIPSVRLKLLKFRCIVCQELKEKRDKFFRKYI